jgi:hypothetical protein
VFLKEKFKKRSLSKTAFCQRTEGYQKTVGFLKEQKALLINSKSKAFWFKEPKVL